MERLCYRRTQGVIELISTPTKFSLSRWGAVLAQLTKGGFMKKNVIDLLRGVSGIGKSHLISKMKKGRVIKIKLSKLDPRDFIGLYTPKGSKPMTKAAIKKAKLKEAKRVKKMSKKIDKDLCPCCGKYYWE